MNPPPLATRETVREQRFSNVWTRELDKIFADVAPYYDGANQVVSGIYFSRLTTPTTTLTGKMVYVR